MAAPIAVLPALIALLAFVAFHAAAAAARVAGAVSAGSGASTGVLHYEYVFDDGTIYVYDMDRSQQLVKTISLPQTEAGVRGVTVSPSKHLLFISYGGDGLGYTGAVLAYDLIADKVVWTANLNTGIDSGQVSPDGSRLYMPTGENTPSGVWNILDTANGAVVGTINGGSGAHNTIASNDGGYVYLGGRDYNYLDVYETATGKVRGIGPLVSGVRPFTVNASNTLAFTTATGFDGFQVSSITTGKVMFTVSFGSVPAGFPITAPSHGASLSPDERELYVIDSPNKAVRVFDVARVAEGVAPTQLAVIPVSGLSGTETPCAYDCGRGGWLQHSLDGRYVYVGDSGEVIDTASRQVVARLAPLANTKKSLEIDWSGGVPIATSGRTGVGYGAGFAPPATPPPAPGPPPIPPATPPATPPSAPTPAPGSVLANPLSAAPFSAAGAQGGAPGEAPVSSPGAQTGGPGARPVIRGMSIRPRTFRALARVGAGAEAGGGAATVRFEDSAAAATTFTVVALGPTSGRAKRECEARTRTRHSTGGARCGRSRALGRFVRDDRLGWNRFAFGGWLRSRKLAPGRYRLTAVPRFDGLAGPQAAVSFQIVR
ncbi:MAG TPA: hypothetical protein VGN13_09105 [Solirubrobacteraceae bacterium]